MCLSLAALAMVFIQQQEHQRDKQEILRLRSLVQAPAPSCEIHENPKIVPVAPEPTLPVMKTPAVSPAPRHPTGDEAKEWRAKKYVEDVEKYLTLSEEDKSKLDTAFKQSGHKLNIAEILGEDRYEKLKEEQAKAKAREQDEQIEGELFRLSRKLTLNADQEQSVRASLRAVQAELASGYKRFEAQRQEAMILHEEPQSDGSALRNLFEQMQALYKTLQGEERTRLREKLRPVLSDDQFNAFLEDQVARENAENLR